MTVDEDGDIRTWNAGAEELYGYDAETAVGMSVAAFHPESDRASGLTDRLLQQTRIAGEASHEGWRVRADGSRFYADVRYASLESEDGASRGYAKVVHDMTEQRRQRRRTERFVEESEDVVTIVDPDGTVTYVSGSAERVFDYDPDALVGENLFDYVHPDGRERAMETFFACVEGAESATAECRLRSPDGGWFNVEGRCRNMLDDDAIDGVLVYLRNVTARKQRARRFEGIFNRTFQATGLLRPDGTVLEVNDTALEFGAGDRESVAGEHIADLAWWDHSDAERETVRDAVTRAVAGEFVRYEAEVRGADGLATIDFSAKPVHDEDGNVSLLIVEGRDITAQQRQRRHLQVLQRVMRHNIRNDLMKLRAWTQAMCEEPDAERRAEHLETVEEILDKWEGMSERMREMRRILRPANSRETTTATDSLIADAVDPVREAHDDATVLTEVPDDWIRAPATLGKAVAELVRNAVEARGDATVEVALTGPTDGWAEVVVRDDGPGMPEMEADVLENGEETPLNHGQGLGLWMVRMIVTQAGGEVSVESTADGTTVRLRLPTDRRPRTTTPVEPTE
ncbi:PAS domain S-box protein [Haloglomus irregulare]